MGGPGPGASFFGGMMKGFGNTFFQARKQKREQELEQEAKQFKVLQDALHTAAGRGDTNAIAHILRSMEEFTAGGGEKKGSKRKEAQQGVLSKFADMLEGGQQTEQSKDAMTQNQEMISAGTPELAERPRLATTKPLLKSNRELGQEKLALEIQEEEAKLPIEIRKYEAQQKILGDRIAQQRAADVDAKLNADLMKLDATETARARRRIQELTVATGDETRAKELYLTEIQTGINKKIADVNLINARIPIIQEDFTLRKQRAERQFKHWDAMEARALEASRRGDKRLATTLQKADYSGKKASITADLRQMGFIQSEINRLHGIVTNTLTPADDRERLKRNLDDLDKQYTNLRENVRQKQDELDSLDTTSSLGESKEGEGEGSVAPQKSLGTPKRRLFGGLKAPSTPSSSQKSMSKDESGYSKGQEVDGSDIGMPAGTKYTYEGLDSEGKAIFRKKKALKKAS